MASSSNSSTIGTGDGPDRRSLQRHRLVRARRAPARLPPRPHVVEGNDGRQAAVVLYVLALVAVVVGVDVLFFRNRFWERADGERRIVLCSRRSNLRFLKRP